MQSHSNKFKSVLSFPFHNFKVKCRGCFCIHYVPKLPTLSFLLGIEDLWFLECSSNSNRCWCQVETVTALMWSFPLGLYRVIGYGCQLKVGGEEFPVTRPYFFFRWISSFPSHWASCFNFLLGRCYFWGYLNSLINNNNWLFRSLNAFHYCYSNSVRVCVLVFVYWCVWVRETKRIWVWALCVSFCVFDQNSGLHWVLDVCWLAGAYMTMNILNYEVWR